MKIVKNTSAIKTKVLRSLICKVHSHMVNLEGRKAPNWKRLRIAVRGRKAGRHTSGRAYYGGYGSWDWDVFLTLPADVTQHRTAWLVYHELMHTYGYRHRQYSNIPKRELNLLFPENATL